jgi:hypothetical protein
MTKFLIGMATAALWFVLSHAANAQRIGDHGTYLSRDMPAGDVVIRR